jgi:hypothetical protein
MVVRAGFYIHFTPLGFSEDSSSLGSSNKCSNVVRLILAKAMKEAEDPRQAGTLDAVAVTYQE